MSRTTEMMPDLTPEAKRFFSVFLDEGGNQAALAKKIGVTQSYLSRVLSGEYGLTDKVIRPTCQNLGYSAEWLILGKGNKKAKPDATKLVTEIQMLRTEIDILTATIKQMSARMKSYEADQNDISKRLSTLERYRS